MAEETSTTVVFDYSFLSYLTGALIMLVFVVAPIAAMVISLALSTVRVSRNVFFRQPLAERLSGGHTRLEAAFVVEHSGNVVKHHVVVQSEHIYPSRLMVASNWSPLPRRARRAAHHNTLPPKAFMSAVIEADLPVTTDDCAMSSMGWIAGSSRIGNGMSTYWH
ncbi:hypothetical protein FOZ63_008389, partial [Perkinsus olseni]